MAFKQISRAGILAVIALIASMVSMFAQQTRTITGKVTDVAGTPITGAVVIYSQTGTMTDADGTYSISGVSGSVNLEFSCLGYKTKVVTVPANTSTANVILKEDDYFLDETIVVGYGIQKKVNLTGAISTVSSKELKNRTANTLTHMLQGSVPGLNVSTSSGNPTDEASINIRGFNSINKGSTPLVLIDGAEGDMSRINPTDVESISVIKDASSAAIYGAKASFGVILITTKKGDDSGKPVVRYSGNFGISTPTTSTDYINTGYESVYITDLFARGTNGTNYTNYTEHDMDELKARINDKTEDPSRPWVITEVRNGKEQYVYYANTDWYDELYTNVNPMWKHNISVSGGNNNIKYYLSGGYEHKQGTFKVRPDLYDKYNFRARMDIKVNDWLSVSNNASYYRSTYDYPGNGSPDYTFCYSAVHGLASFPLRNPDGTFVYKTNFISSNVTNGCHMELWQNTKYNLQTRDNLSNTFEATAHVLKGLDIKADYTYTISGTEKMNRWTNCSYSTYPGEILWDTQGRFQNMLEQRVAKTTFNTVNIYADYTKNIGEDHHIHALAGFNYAHSHTKNNYFSGRNLSSDYLNDFNLVAVDPNTGSKVFEITGGQDEWADEGIFGRVNYDYKEKYLFETSWRYDGTSRFANSYKWTLNPSASIGWKFTEEDWAKDIEWLSYGKLRFSYGTLGNNQVGSYEFYRTVNVNSSLGYLFESDTQKSTGSTISAPASKTMTWEKARHFNLGLDGGLYDNRLTFSTEAYIRTTEGMLVSGESIPAVYGTSSPRRNGANLASYGYELTIAWKDQMMLWGKPLSYGITGTLADYITKITKYDNPQKVFGSYYEGQTIGEIWGFKTDGLFASDAEAAEYTSRVDQSYLSSGLSGGWRGGDIKFLDLDGDDIISVGGYTVDNPGDKRIIGNSEPRWQYGLTLDARYMGFDIMVFFQGIGRMDWYPPEYCHSFWYNFNQCSQTYVPKDFLSKVWSEDNLDAYYPRPRSGLGNQSGTELTMVNDRYLINIGYCRLKNLTIGYTLEEKLLRKLPINGARVFFTGENLGYTSPLKKITKYMDPEQCRTSSYLGFLYPWQKTFTIGIDITF